MKTSSEAFKSIREKIQQKMREEPQFGGKRRKPMNLSKLFEMQRELDERIMDEHPELKGQNNLDWKILALQVE